jgi:hypothetical protein
MWVDNIKMNFVEIGCGVDWIDLTKDKGKRETSFEHGNELSGSMKFWESVEWLHNRWALE